MECEKRLNQPEKLSTDPRTLKLQLAQQRVWWNRTLFGASRTVNNNQIYIVPYGRTFRSPNLSCPYWPIVTLSPPHISISAHWELGVLTHWPNGTDSVFTATAFTFVEWNDLVSANIRSWNYSITHCALAHCSGIGNHTFLLSIGTSSAGVRLCCIAGVQTGELVH